jgi:hypothetical protein
MPVPLEHPPPPAQELPGPGIADIADVPFDEIPDPVPDTMRAVHFWMVTTDAGSDERKARAMLLAKTESLPNTLVFDIDCLAHQYQLMVLGALNQGEKLFKSELAAPFPYYGTLSKLMIVWREHARDIFDTWADKHGPMESIKYARRIPPKCIRGRWGAVSRCEVFALAPPIDHLMDVLMHVAQQGTKPSRKKQQSLDEAEAEDAECYSEKMARWRQDVRTRISEPRFWAMMQVSHRVRQPLDHFVHYVMKKTEGPADPQPLARLVWYKALSIRDDLAAMLDVEVWGIWELIPADLVDRCKMIGYQLILRIVADFEVRIIGRLHTMPVRLLFFGHNPAGFECAQRKRISLDLLDTPDSALHPTAAKFKRPSASLSRCTGKLSYNAQCLVRL